MNLLSFFLVDFKDDRVIGMLDNVFDSVLDIMLEHSECLSSFIPNNIFTLGF